MASRKYGERIMANIPTKDGGILQPLPLEKLIGKKLYSCPEKFVNHKTCGDYTAMANALLQGLRGQAFLPS
jgi:hypothetical protein